MNDEKLAKSPVVENSTSRLNSQKVSIYFPKKSYGWLSLLLAALVFTVLGYLALQAYSLTGDIGAMVTLIISACLVVDCLVMTVWFFSMRYELSPEALVIRFGPLSYSIDLKAVVEVSSKNLKQSFWPGLKLPGFSLFYLIYREDGKIFMCATRVQKDITLIETENRKFGITPDKEDLFNAELNSYLKALKPYKKVEKIY